MCSADLMSLEQQLGIELTPNESYDSQEVSHEIDELNQLDSDGNALLIIAVNMEFWLKHEMNM